MTLSEQPWLLSYQLVRGRALDQEERAALHRHVARWGCPLELCAGGDVLASGQVQLSREPEDPGAARFMLCLAELREVVAGSRLVLKSQHGPKVKWSGSARCYHYNPFIAWL